MVGLHRAVSAAAHPQGQAGAGVLAAALLAAAATLVLFLTVVRPAMAGPVTAPCDDICYVDVITGNDANDGETPETALATIQHGINSVHWGGRVIVAAGIYDETVIIKKSVSLEGAQFGVDARDRTGDESLITGDNSDAAILIRSREVTVDGFSVRNDYEGAWTTINAYMEDGSGGARQLRVNNNIVTGVDAEFGIDIFCAADCRASNNVVSGHDGVGIVGEGGQLLRFRENEVFDNGDGLLLYETSDAIVSASEFYGLDIGQQNGVILTDCTDCLVEGNLFRDQDYGVYMDDAPSYATIDANTFTNLDDEGVDIDEGGSYVISRNTFDGLGDDAIDIEDFDWPMHVTVTNNFFRDIHDGFGDGDGISVEGDDNVILIVNQNSFENVDNAIDVFSDDALAQDIDATLNWWNAKSGPGGDFAGSGEDVFNNDDFFEVIVDPWLCRGVDIDEAQPGFQPKLGVGLEAPCDDTPPTITFVAEQLLPSGIWAPYDALSPNPPWVSNIVRVQVVCEDEEGGSGIEHAPTRLLYMEEGDREMIIPAGEYGGFDNELQPCIDRAGNVADPSPQVTTRVDRSSPSCTAKPVSTQFLEDGTFKTVIFKVKKNDPFFGKVGVSLSVLSATGNDGAKPNHVEVVSNKEIRFKAMTKTFATRTYQVVWQVEDRAGNTGTCSAKVLIKS